MARFSQNTIRQVAGFDQSVIAEELLFGQDDYWDVTVTDGATPPQPLNLTGWVFEFRLIRRQVTSIIDGRNGIEFPNGIQPASGATTMDLDSNVKVIDAATGKIRLLIDDSFFSQLPPAIDTTTPPVYTGYLGCTLPASGTPGEETYIPAQTKKILLLFVVQSDGISSQMNP